MFWKIFEFIIRIIYFRRFRAAKKIGEAGSLLGAGKPEEALSLLEKTGATLHQSLLPIYAFTRGKILDALGRCTQAEEAFRLVVLTDPENAKADLELAILAGRRFDFKECEEWLDRLDEKNDDTLESQASGIRNLLNGIVKGEREKEFQKRALIISNKITGENRESVASLPDMKAIEEWIKQDSNSAKQDLDEIALLLGQSMVAEGAKWKINLSIDESVVVLEDGTEINPFEKVARLFD